MEDDLQEKAKEFGVNVSHVCREAVRQAVLAAETVKRFDDREYELITALFDAGKGEDELVEFVGSLAYYHEDTDWSYYITPKRTIAWVDGDGYMGWDDDLSSWPPGVVRQRLEEELGRTPTPTRLDI